MILLQRLDGADDQWPGPPAQDLVAALPGSNAPPWKSSLVTRSSWPVSMTSGKTALGRGRDQAASNSRSSRGSRTISMRDSRPRNPSSVPEPECGAGRSRPARRRRAAACPGRRAGPGSRCCSNRVQPSEHHRRPDPASGLSVGWPAMVTVSPARRAPTSLTPVIR